MSTLEQSGETGGPLPRIILGSGSPRRRDLLRQVGIPFDVVRPEVDEERFSHGDPSVLAKAIADAKARAVLESSGSSDRWILSADTVVAAGGHILGKPRDRDHAAAMIRLLAGRAHSVVTGLAIVVPGRNDPVITAAETTVSFAAVSESELGWYLDTEDWRDVAGAYRIQGHAARYIDWMSGSYSNVVGLPIHLVYSILYEHGYPFG
jgi:septum formation protein